MVKKFATLQAAMSPEAQARSAAKAEAMLLKMQLQALRKSRNATQIETVNLMSVEQAPSPNWSGARTCT